MDNYIEAGDKMKKQYNVVIPVTDIGTAEIIRAEIKHKLGYVSNIEEEKQ